MSILLARISWAVIRFIIGPILLVAACFLGYAFLIVDPHPGWHWTRADVSRIKAGQRSLATAIEGYFLDHGAYPRGWPLREYTNDAEALRRMGGWNLETLGPGQEIGDRAFVTPSRLSSDYLLDPFTDSPRSVRSRADGTLPFAYYADGHGGWLLFSAGPDRDYDTVPDEDYDSSEEVPSASLLTKIYDPTNGPFSNGDVYRWKQ